MMYAHQEEQQHYEELELLKKRLYNKPFYIWIDDVHTQQYKNSKGTCCWWDLVGRPTKNEKEMPLLPYQKSFYQMLHEKRRLWVKNARGIGLSTLMLYIIAYKCFTEFKQGDRVVIITGIRIETVADLIRRLKLLFQKNFPGLYAELTKQKDTLCLLNNVICEGYPAGHTDSVRGLDRVKLLWVDECDWFEPKESKAVRSATEAFISKPNSEDMYLVLSSTANSPGGLLQTLELEDPSIYYKMFLLYQYGLEGPSPIYDLKQLNQAKLLPDFPREYEGQYLGVVGNVFSSLSIEDCQKIQYNPTVIVRDAPKSCAIDPAYGSSNFAITVTQLVDGKIQVIEASEWSRPDFNEMVDKVWELKTKCGHISNIYVDASNPSFIQKLKQIFGEPFDDQYIRDKQAYCRKHNLHIENEMFIVPTPFSIEGKKMLSNAKWLMDEKDSDGTSLIAIHPSFDKLLISLRTATASEWKLQKDQVSFNDILDSFLMALQYYKRTK